ncbi:hypothetical protein ABFX02_05G059200 [Erythranthe guttata]
MASLNDGEHHKQKSLDQEVREMISTLTNRLGSIQRSHPKSSSAAGGSGPHDDEDDDGDRGVRIITLAGTNLGATMRGGETDENSTGPGEQGLARPGQEEEEDFATYVNSNFQAINNSIMFGGTYTTNDPGVHLDISDYYHHRQKDDDDAINKTNGKKVRKNNNNKRGGSISNKSDDRLTERSDKSTSDDEKKP